MKNTNLPQGVKFIACILLIAALLTIAVPVLADESGIFFMYSMLITMMVGAPILIGLGVRGMMIKVQPSYYTGWLLPPILSWLGWAGIYTLIVKSQIKLSIPVVFSLVSAAALCAPFLGYYLKRTLTERA